MGSSEITRLPPRVSDRAVIRVITPCGAAGPHLAAIERGISQLESLNCEVRWDTRRANSEWRGYLAGTDELRVEEFVAAMEEPDVDVVWIGRGGSGSARIMGGVLNRISMARPRCVVGFSDATTIVNSLSQRHGLVCFHGPVVSSLGRPGHETDATECLAVLRGERHHLDLPEQDGPTVSGVLKGGNLTVLASLVGTTLAPEASNEDLWFFEDVQEAPYRLDRSLWQIKSSGILEGARGICLGDFDLDESGHAALVAMFREEFDVPVYEGFPAGHRGALQMSPVGVRLTLRPNLGWLGSQSPWVQGHG